MTQSEKDWENRQREEVEHETWGNNYQNKTGTNPKKKRPKLWRNVNAEGNSLYIERQTDKMHTQI